MSSPRAAAALRALVMLLASTLALAGCSVLRGGASTASTGGSDEAGVAPPAGGTETAAAATAAAEAASAAAAAARVGVVVDAPAELRTLLERYLDLIRLGRMAREGVDESEWSRLIDATPAQVRELLQTEGYFSPTIRLDRGPPRSAGELGTVVIHVDPGPRASVDKVTLEMEGDLQTGAVAGITHAKDTLAEFREGWPLPVGSRFRNGTWVNAKSAAIARLRAAGYATANWLGTGAEVDPVHNTVRLYLVADSGPLFRYGELQIDGLATTEAQTVLNMVGADRGAPVTDSFLLDFQERLQRSGLFQTATVNLVPNPAHADSARVHVRLREAPRQSLTAGVGVSANTGPRASLEDSYRRLFGYNASLHNKVEYGQLHKYWNGEITSYPLPGLHQNLVGGAVEQLTSDTDVVLSQRVRLGRSQDAQHIERLVYVEAERSLRRTFDEVINSKAIAVSLNYQWSLRALDSLVLPTYGFSLTSQAGVGHSHGDNAEPGPFTRLYLRATGYLPLGRSWYGQARVEAGQVFLRSTMVVPESQQFRAGGDESVRGYDYRSLGPIVDGAVGSGNVLYTSSIELAHPIVQSIPSLWGAVFIDAGNAGNSFKHLHPAVGAGFGVRWRSPVGPLRADWAYGRDTHKSKLLFSVGVSF
jgi:translocation and assembly module TamA